MYFIAPFLCFFLLFSSPISAIDSKNKKGFIPSKHIENKNATHVKRIAGRSRAEGWAELVFVVGSDGVPFNITILNANKDPHIKNSAIRYVENLLYSPAIFNGDVVLSTNTFTFRYDISFYGSNNDGINPKFGRMYDEIDNKILRGELADLDPLFTRLEEEETKNLTEQALFAWLQTSYHARKQNWLDYRDNLLVANSLRDILPVNIAVKNTQNLIAWYQYTKQYTEAMLAVNSLLMFERVKFDEEAYQAFMKPLYLALSTGESNTISVTLSENQVWQHVLPRKTFSIEVLTGDIENIELGCANYWGRINLEELSQYSVNDDYIDCSILVKGVANTNIMFTEKGPLKGRWQNPPDFPAN